MLDDLQGERFHLEDPPVASGKDAAELVIMRIVDRIVAVASVNHAVDEITFALWRIAGALGYIRWIVNGKAEMIDGALIVSKRRAASVMKTSRVPMRHLLYGFCALCAKVVHICHCSVLMHDPDVAVDAVTIVLIFLHNLRFRGFYVFLVLGDDQILDMIMK